MPKKDKSEPSTKVTMPALISERVLERLGRPKNLVECQVNPLWGDHYRINVMVGEERRTARNSHSYFVRIGPEGDIKYSDPPIVKSH